LDGLLTNILALKQLNVLSPNQNRRAEQLGQRYLPVVVFDIAEQQQCRSEQVEIIADGIRHNKTDQYPKYRESGLHRKGNQLCMYKQGTK
jgi:hypothetical protein